MNELMIQPKPVSRWTWAFGVYFTLGYLGSWAMVVFVFYDVHYRPGVEPGVIRWDVISGLIVYEIIMTSSYLCFWWWYLPRFHLKIEGSDGNCYFKRRNGQFLVNLDAVDELIWHCGFWRRLMVLKVGETTRKINLAHYLERDQLQLVQYFRGQISLERQTGWEQFSWKHVGTLLPEIRTEKKNRPFSLQQFFSKSRIVALALISLVGMFFVSEQLSFVRPSILFVPLMFSGYWYSFQAVNRVHFFNGLATSVMWKPLFLAWVPGMLALGAYALIHRPDISEFSETVNISAAGYLLALIVMIVCLMMTQGKIDDMFEDRIRELKQAWNKHALKHFDVETVS